MTSFLLRQKQRAEPDSVPARRDVPDGLALAPPDSGTGTPPDSGTGTPPDSGTGTRLAMCCYLSLLVLGFLGPLAIYLARRRVPQVRWHAVQALNLWITTALYSICALITGAMLALDAISVALIIVTPLAAALWLAALCFLIRAAVLASRGGRCEIPAWLCAPVIR